MPRLLSPELPAEDALLQKLEPLLGGSDHVQWRLQQAKQLCFESGTNGHPPQQPFLNFSQRCMEAGEFRTANEAYSYAMKKEMPTYLFDAGVVKFEKRLQDLDMDPKNIAKAIQNRTEQCMSQTQRKTSDTESVAA